MTINLDHDLVTFSKELSGIFNANEAGNTEPPLASKNQYGIPHYICYLLFKNPELTPTNLVFQITQNLPEALKVVRESGVIGDTVLLDFATNSAVLSNQQLLKLLNLMDVNSWGDFISAHVGSKGVSAEFMPPPQYIKGRAFTDRLMEIFGVETIAELSVLLNVPESTFRTWHMHDRTSHEIACRISIYTGIPVTEIIM